MASARVARSATPGPILAGVPAQSKRQQCRSTCIPSFYTFASRFGYTSEPVPSGEALRAGYGTSALVASLNRGCEIIRRSMHQMKALQRGWLVAILSPLLLVGVVAPPASATAQQNAPVAASAPSSSVATSSSEPAAPATLTAWTSPMDLLLQPFPKLAADNATVRDLATVAVGGRWVSLRFSNQWGPIPLTFGAVTIGERAGTGGAAAVPGTVVPVTFNGSSSVTIPPGQDVTSNPVTLPVQAGETLVVSMWAPGLAPVSVHYCCQGRTVSYYTRNGGGNQTGSLNGSAFTGADWWTRWLSAVEVGGSQALGTVVAFGDSITDGFGADNAGFSWVDALQQRISQLPADEQVAVVDEGIAGNTLTAFPPGDNAHGGENSFAATGGGAPGVARLGRDALQLPGVKAVVVLLGTNDIWFGYADNDPPYGSAASIIAGLKQVIAQVHAAGLKVYGVPLLPRKTSPPCSPPSSCIPEDWTASEQATLQAVNSWATGPGTGFDGVINLAAVMGDVYDGQCQPALPFTPYFNADNLHPNPAGQTAMANAIPTTLFGIPEAPQLPPVVAVTPTPGCPGAQAAENVLAAASPAGGRVSTGGGRVSTRPSTSASPTSGPTTTARKGGSTTTSPQRTSTVTSPTTTRPASSTSASVTTRPASPTSASTTSGATSTSSVAASSTAPGGTQGRAQASSPLPRRTGSGGDLGGAGVALVVVLAFAGIVLIVLALRRRGSGSVHRR